MLLEAMEHLRRDNECIKTMMHELAQNIHMPLQRSSPGVQDLHFQSPCPDLMSDASFPPLPNSGNSVPHLPPRPPPKERAETPANMHESQRKSYADAAEKSDGEKWQTALNKKRKQRRHITGSSTDSRLKAAPEPSRDLFIYWVDKETTDDDMLTHVTQFGITPKNLKRMSHDDAAKKSYKLTVSASEYKTLLDSAKWPTGIRVRRFIPPKNPPENRS